MQGPEPAVPALWERSQIRRAADSTEGYRPARGPRKAVPVSQRRSDGDGAPIAPIHQISWPGRTASFWLTGGHWCACWIVSYPPSGRDRKRLQWVAKCPVRSSWEAGLGDTLKGVCWPLELVYRQWRLVTLRENAKRFNGRRSARGLWR